MIYIKDDADLKNCKDFVDQFKVLYNYGFPDIHEREEFENILERVKGNRTINDPNTFLILNSVNNKIVAGQIADWYFESKCIHLTYLIVDPKYRQHGIARKILKEEIPKIIKEIKEQNEVEIKTVFFESNNPSLTKIDSFDSKTRLTIFKKLGAKWIDIPYIQPALDSNKKKVNNLYLLTLPINENGYSMNIDLIISFLKSLYLSLNIAYPFKNSDFNSMVEALMIQKDKSNNVKLKEILLI